MLLLQEFYYGIFILIFGFAIGIQHGAYSGLKAFLLAFVFIQFIILWVNRKVIKAALTSNFK